MERGFALITGRDGTIVTTPQQVETGDAVSVRFADGTVQAEITGKESI